MPLALLTNQANIWATGKIAIEIWKKLMSNLILRDATGTWKGSKLYQGSETGEAWQKWRYCEGAMGDSENVRSYTIEAAEDRPRTQITVA